MAEQAHSTDGLIALVQQRLEADNDVSDEAKLLVLAALEGDDAFTDMAGVERRSRERETSPDAQGQRRGIFLEHITVQGFRGIGPEASVRLSPKPGVTVIAGRNGSGKSSFAEALELALTGTSKRWDERSKQWEDAWRNLHDGNSPRIHVRFVQEGSGRHDLSVEWAAGADLASAEPYFQQPGSARVPGRSRQWDDDVSLFPPLLTYEGLGQVLTGGPSKLHDALSGPLGLSLVSDARARLDQLATELKAPEGVKRQAKKDALAALDSWGRPEAAAMQKAVRAHSTSSVEARKLATSRSAQPMPDELILRRVETAELSSTSEVLAKFTTARDAESGLSGAVEDAVAKLERRLAVAAAALDLFEHHGDQDCPACGTGRIDQARAVEVRDLVQSAERQVSTLRERRTRFASASASLTETVSVPDWLSSWAAPNEVSADVSALIASWRTARALALNSEATEQDVEAGWSDVANALAVVKASVSGLLERRHEEWGVVAGKLHAFADALQAFEESDADRVAAVAAQQWLSEHDRQLRNERLEPIAEKASLYWGLLRQESNVDLSSIRFDGDKKRRRLELGTMVDGAPAPGMTVLSQGELHALALSLFLPRASMDASPFSFVVLDDPVQAMDPSKVDGLLAVLLDLAKTHQVVVFSHDDRLAQAASRVPAPVTVLDVHRHQSSAVSVHERTDAAQRYVDEARALVKDRNVDSALLNRVLPGLLRFAVEAAAKDLCFTRKLAEGVTRAAVEEEWAGAVKTSSRLKLALRGDRNANIDSWLNVGNRQMALGVVSTGFHDGLRGDPRGACSAVDHLVRAIRSESS